MAEVLSQSQIDALLAAAQSGQMDLDAPAEEAVEKKYRKYDFYSPRKFTKDRIRMLNSIFENYTRVINSRLNALLHSTCEIEVDSVEEQRYHEFSNALRESDVLALVKTDHEEYQEETPILLHLDTTVLLTILDRMMGGEGDPDDAIDSEYNLTDLELKIYSDVIEDLVSVLGRSWENYMSINFEYVRTEVNPTLVQLIGFDETVVIVGLHIQFPNNVATRGRPAEHLPAGRDADQHLCGDQQEHGTAQHRRGQIRGDLRLPAGLRSGDCGGAGQDKAAAQRHLPPERGRCGGYEAVQGRADLPEYRRPAVV